MKSMGAVAGLAGFALVSAITAAEAQPAAGAASPADAGPVNITVFRGSAVDGPLMGFPDQAANVEFFTTPLAVGGEPVAGAPYSADALTEVVQTLADGNRIVRQSKVALFRDGKGRTRREQGLAVLGNFVAGGDGERTRVQIHDPEAGSMYLLDTKRREARRLPAPKVQLSWGGGPGDAGSRFFESIQVDRANGAQHTAIMRRFGAGTPGPRTDANTEQLGRRTIEGVEAEGTRTTVVIPAGQIGNEAPINIVSERWYSPELKLLIMTRHTDPRFGETTYRLTNIVRAEPAPELFTVPSDYRVIERERELRDRLRLRRKPQ